MKRSHKSQICTPFFAQLQFFVRKNDKNERKSSTFATKLNIRPNDQETMTLKEYFEGDRFASNAGMVIDEIGEGYGRVHVLVDDRHLNGANYCQGGVIFTLADLAFACATNSHGTPTVTVNANITLLHAVEAGSTLTAEAHELFDHKTLPYVEVRVTDETGTLVAMMTASGYRRRNAPPLV